VINDLRERINKYTGYVKIFDKRDKTQRNKYIHVRHQYISEINKCKKHYKTINMIKILVDRMDEIINKKRQNNLNNESHLNDSLQAEYIDICCKCDYLVKTFEFDVLKEAII
jgi:hypothetical protein